MSTETTSRRYLAPDNFYSVSFCATSLTATHLCNSVLFSFSFLTKFSSLLSTINFYTTKCTQCTNRSSYSENSIRVFSTSFADGTDLVEGFLLVLVHLLHYQFVCRKYTLLLSLQYSTLVN